MARRKGRSVSDVSRYTAPSSKPTGFGQDDFDDSPISGVSFFLISMTLFLVIAVSAVYFGTRSIEASLEASATQALASEFPEVSAEVHGVAVTLSGRYTTQDPERAFALVSEIEGVGEVDGTIWPIATEELDAAATKGATLEATWVQGTLSIIGTVSTAERVTFIETSLTDKLTTVSEEDEAEGILPALVTIDSTGVTLDESLEDETAWLGPAISLLIATVERVPEGLFKADWSTSYLAISGDVEDKAVRDELNDEVKDLGVEVGFSTVIGGILVPRTGPTKEEVEAVQEEIDEVILDQVVEFEIKSFDLTDDGKMLLDEVADALAKNSEVLVLIEGHTDSQGSDEENLLLSRDRANAVLEYLIGTGLERERFTTIGYGETQPVESNDTDEGRSKNRRIEFTVQFDNVDGEEGGG